MAKRKQTTASPEKIPMNTDRTRNKRSSRKTDRSRAPRGRSGNKAARSACPFSSAVPDCELGEGSTLVPFVQLRDQKQRQIGPGRRSACGFGLAFDFKYEIHRPLGEVRISSQVALIDLRLHFRPAVGEALLQALGRRRPARFDRGGTGLEPVSCSRKCFDDNSVALVG